MSDDASIRPGDPATADGSARLRKPGRWWLAVAMAFVLLVGLDWLLARLIWLPYYFGLFFFLVAGLLVGALSFRQARPARPIPKGPIVTGVVLLAFASSLVTVVWEYRNVAATAGGKRRFPEARSAAVTAGRPPSEVASKAARAFVSALRADYPPGGPIGYVRWAIASGEMNLTVEGCKDAISVDHHGLAWPLRSLAGMLLLAAGLWLSFESLRSGVPVSNILAPGEEAQDDEDADS